MKRLALIVAFTISLAGCSPADQPTAGSNDFAVADAPDTVYTNGKIYTVNEAQPWAEAVAIKDGEFVVVGSNADVAAVTSDTTNVIDLAGAFAMPGLIDIHTHPSMSMAFRVFCELPGTFYNPTDDMTVEALKKCIEKYPDDQEWFIAEGWSSPVMDSETLTKEFLDQLIPDRPAYIKDETGHFAWVNTKGFELIGIDENTPDTAEGYFSRKADGTPAGQVFEEAMNAFENVIMPLPPEISQAAKLRLLNNATAKGITAIADAYVFERDLDDWQKFKQQGKLDLHTKLFFKGNLGDAVLTPASEILGYYENYDLPGEPGVKMGMGGMLESRTSAMLNDGYLDGSQAPLLIPPAEFAAYMKTLDEAGIQAKVHAVGDGSIRATMEGFIAGFEKRGSNELRHHIDHCMYPNADDMKIMAEKEIPCSAWPVINAPVGFVMAHAEIIKPEAFAQVTPTRDLIDSGVLAANHTDAPQANLWPWWGMEASITRKFPGEPEIEPLNVNQGISLEETIVVYTINGAKVLLLSDLTGSIEEGKSADMIVLNHNLFEIPVTEIHKTAVQKTIFKGELVYEGD